MLVDVSLRQEERDGKVEYSTSVSSRQLLNLTVCAGAAKEPLYAAKVREDAKLIKYPKAYKNLDDIHFEPFFVES